LTEYLGYSRMDVTRVRPIKSKVTNTNFNRSAKDLLKNITGDEKLIPVLENSLNIWSPVKLMDI